MKRHLVLLVAIIATMMLSFGTAHAQRDYLCEHLYLPAGIQTNTFCLPLP